jgi:hypothetical protein
MIKIKSFFREEAILLSSLGLNGMAAGFGVDSTIMSPAAL